MEKIDKNTIKKMAKLSQLALTSDEENLYAEQLEHILNYVSQLSEVNANGIEPMVTATDMPITLREDVVQKKFTAEEIVSNAPDKSGNLFKVPPVL